MPELKPCPHCGSENIHVASTRAMYVIACYGCSMAGPCSDAQEAAIATWNSLPRALTWTTEPPKVEHVGKWFWSKLPGKNTVPVIVAELDGVLGIGRGTSEEGLTMETCREFGVKFAGPIPTPLEPEES